MHIERIDSVPHLSLVRALLIATGNKDITSGTSSRKRMRPLCSWKECTQCILSDSPPRADSLGMPRFRVPSNSGPRVNALAMHSEVNRRRKWMPSLCRAKSLRSLSGLRDKGLGVKSEVNPLAMRSQVTAGRELMRSLR